MGGGQHMIAYKMISTCNEGGIVGMGSQNKGMLSSNTTDNTPLF